MDAPYERRPLRYFPLRTFLGKSIRPFEETKAVPLEKDPCGGCTSTTRKLQRYSCFRRFFHSIIELDIEERRYPQLTNYCAHSNLLLQRI